MAGIKVEAFGGAIPSRDVRLLPEINASVSINQRVESGALEPVREPRFLVDLLSTTRAVYRIPQAVLHDLTSSYWVQFTDPNTDVIRTPVVNDSYERHYWASPSTGFKFATKTELMGGGTGRNPGIARPTPRPTLDIIAGTGAKDDKGKLIGPIVTRSYVVSFVGEYGEEGPPSLPVEARGAVDQDWRLRDIPQPVTSVGNSVVDRIRIYRTETSASGSTVFNQVVDLSVGTTIYIDRLSSLEVTGNPELPDFVADPPPAGMCGLALMPNGVLVGFKDNNVYFSDNFRPHAWPAAFTLAVQHKIVGLAVFGTTCVVVTEGNPVAISGSSGSVMSMSMSDTPMPCVSRQSIVSAPEGVYWATPSGLVLYGPGGMQTVSGELIGRGAWARDYNPATIDAVYIDGCYTALRQQGLNVNGFTIQGGSVIELNGFTGSGAGRSIVTTDVYTDRPLLIQDSKLYEWLPSNTTYKTTRWRSKEYMLPKPVNMAVGVLYFDAPVNSTAQVRVWARGNLVYDQAVTNGRFFRLPGGVKSDIWQLEVEASLLVRRLLIAQSVDELKAL